VPHWPTTISNSFDIPDIIDEQTGNVIAPGQPATLYEVQDRDNVYLLVNNDNDDRDAIPADPSSNYPDDRFESSGDPVLKNQTGKRDDDAIMVRIAFPGAENINSGTLELRVGSTAGSIDSRVAIYHAAGRDSDGVLLTAGQLSLDLANPNASNPLKPLADGEEVKVFIEGVFALQALESVDVGLYLTIDGNETKLSDFTLKLHKTEAKSMRFVAHSSVGSDANGWTKERLQDSSNAIRIDNDLEADDDRMVPVNLRRRGTIPIVDGNERDENGNLIYNNGGLDLRQISSSSSGRFEQALVREILGDYLAQYYVTDQVTDAGGFSMVNNNGTPTDASDDFPYGMIIIPHRKGNSSLADVSTDKYVIAHEWLHAFAGLGHRSCLDQNLMVNQED